MSKSRLSIIFVTNVLDSISTSCNSIESVMTLSLVESRIARSHDYFVIYLFIYLVIFCLHSLHHIYQLSLAQSKIIEYIRRVCFLFSSVYLMFCYYYL